MPLTSRRFATVAAALVTLAACGGSEGTAPAPQCTAAAQCPGADTECRTRTCASGACGFSYAADTVVVASQTTGDCQVNRCDGAGGVHAVADDADVPADDGNACTSESCAGGVPVHPFLDANTACTQGGGSYCDGAGACVECTAAAQCGIDSECRTFTCFAGSCGVSDQVPGTTISSQTPGDCQSNVCDGTGGVTSVPLDSDVPADDGNTCTSEICNAGAPAHPPATTGTACNQGGGTVCDGAASCVACNVAADCGTSTACKTFTCTAHVCGSTNALLGTVVANPTPGDCHTDQCDGSGNVVANGVDNADVPADDGNQCTAEVCTAGAPAHPARSAGAACTQSGGSQCNGAGACVQCLAAADCGTSTACKTFTCNAGSCGSYNAAAGTVVANPTPGDCHTNQCDGAGNVTANAIDDTDVPADDGNQCTRDICTSGTPGHPASASGTSCSQGGGSSCNGTGSCVQCLAAADCGTNTACKTFTCNAGFCGSNNTAAGTVVANPTVGDCRTNQCDGIGNLVTNAVDNGDLPADDGNQCTLDTCTSGAPVHPVAASGTPCNQSGGTVCDDAGACHTEPAVAATTPPDGGTAAPTTTVAITFTEAMAVPTLQESGAPGCRGSIQLSDDGFATCAMFSSATAEMSDGNRTATFFPVPALLLGRTYQIRVTRGALSAFGIALPSVYTSPTGFATTTVNETGLALEADYCVVQFPASMTVQTGMTTPTVYGQIYEHGVTEGPGPSASVTAELGFGPTGATPEIDPGWTWRPAAYNVQSGNNDEYQATFTAPAVGTYRYAYRFSLDGGTTWTYCDADGAGSNSGLTFDLARVPILTVTP